MNAVDSVFDWSKSLSLARMSMHDASSTANGNPLGLGGSKMEKESDLLDGYVNEKGQSNKKDNNGLELRMGEVSVVWMGLISIVQRYGRAGSELVLRNREKPFVCEPWHNLFISDRDRD